MKRRGAVSRIAKTEDTVEDLSIDRKEKRVPTWVSVGDVRFWAFKDLSYLWWLFSVWRRMIGEAWGLSSLFTNILPAAQVGFSSGFAGDNRCRLLSLEDTGNDNGICTALERLKNRRRIVDQFCSVPWWRRRIFVCLVHTAFWLAQWL